MIVALPKERAALVGVEEKRVALTPAGVRELQALGAELWVASGAGEGAGFGDEEYRGAGAHLAYGNEEVVRRAAVVVKVARPRPDEWGWFSPGTGLLCWLHPLVAPPEFLALLQERRLTAIALERVQEDDGSLPILRPTSEIAGRMAVQIAGRMLESHAGGRGVLLSGIPGIPPADVVILGAGTLGTSAARAFLGAGARVHLFDRDLRRLSDVDALLQGRAVTALATKSAIEKFVAFADVLIGAVHVPGKRAPVLVTEAMVKNMQPGALVLDFSIDQGGCVATSTLTPREDYVFTAHGVLHFCAPNVSALVARTASHAMNNALLPYLRRIVQNGLPDALRGSAALRRSLAAQEGTLDKELIRSWLASRVPGASRHTGGGGRPVAQGRPHLRGGQRRQAQGSAPGPGRAGAGHGTPRRRPRPAGRRGSLRRARGLRPPPPQHALRGLGGSPGGGGGARRPHARAPPRHPAPVRLGAASLGCLPHPDLASRRARLRFPGRRVPGYHGRGGRGTDRSGGDQPPDAADAGRLLRAPVQGGEADRGRSPPARARQARLQRGGAQDRREYCEPGRGRGHLAARDRRHPRRHPGFPRGPARPGDPHGDDLRRHPGRGGGGDRHRRAQDRAQGEGGGHLRHGNAAPLRLPRQQPDVRLHPCDYTNNPGVIASNDKMIAVNSAIEVDLTGQVCADSIGTKIYSGFGGQLDFIRGARRSKGGKPIVALASTARDGAISRIAPLLQPGAGVVTTRADVHYVVTEYGIADLFGRSLRERAEALIAIAHPHFREELARAARERKLLGETFALGQAARGASVPGGARD